MYINIIKSYRDVVALCDKELLGQTFEDGDFQIHVKENFYKGKPENQTVSRAEVHELLDKYSAEDATFNIVGAKSVEVAKEADIITDKDIGEIEGVPFALVLL